MSALPPAVPHRCSWVAHYPPLTGDTGTTTIEVVVPRRPLIMSDQTSVPAALATGERAPDRNLALELVRVTEAAAMAAARWVGRGDKNGADGAAVNAMRQL